MKDRLSRIFFGNEKKNLQFTTSKGEIIFTKDTPIGSVYPNAEEKRKLRENANRVLGIARQRGRLSRFPKP